jgi:spore photoproduct lyase
LIGAVYVEEAVADHPRTVEILGRLPASVPRIECRRYGEIFNRRGQSFRLQKRRPALILAQKEGRRVLPTPPGYGIGGERNFYFSHMLNCVYDCRYCFLQGMYRSAHYVVFVNFEDFFEEAAELASGDLAESYFFSGYDADSLALEGLTGFAASALDEFRAMPRAWLELRTKSARMAPLLEQEPWERCVVAMSFTPRAVSEELEHKVPSIERRLGALEALAERGWRLGLRFDPLVWHPDFRAQYGGLFEQVFGRLPAESLHSVTFGPFRLPAPFFRRLERLYPEEPLLAGAFEERGGMVSYRRELEEEMVGFCHEALGQYVPAERFFPCAVEPEGTAP